MIGHENYSIQQLGIYRMIEDLPTTHRASNELKVLKSLVTAVRNEAQFARGISHILAIRLSEYENIVEGKK